MENVTPVIELKDYYLGPYFDLDQARYGKDKNKILALRESVSKITLVCAEAGLSVEESAQVIDAAKSLIHVSPAVFVNLQDDPEK